MEGSKKDYVGNTAEFSSAGLIIRQKEPKNLEAPFDRIDSLPHSDGAVLHTQPFSDNNLGRRRLPTTHRWCGQASVHLELRRVANHAIRDPGRDFGMRR